MRASGSLLHTFTIPLHKSSTLVALPNMYCDACSAITSGRAFVHGYGRHDTGFVKLPIYALLSASNTLPGLYVAAISGEPQCSSVMEVLDAGRDEPSCEFIFSGPLSKRGFAGESPDLSSS